MVVGAGELSRICRCSRVRFLVRSNILVAEHDALNIHPIHSAYSGRIPRVLSGARSGSCSHPRLYSDILLASVSLTANELLWELAEHPTLTNICTHTTSYCTILLAAISSDRPRTLRSKGLIYSPLRHHLVRRLLLTSPEPGYLQSCLLISPVPNALRTCKYRSVGSGNFR